MIWKKKKTHEKWLIVFLKQQGSQIFLETNPFLPSPWFQWAVWRLCWRCYQLVMDAHSSTVKSLYLYLTDPKKTVQHLIVKTPWASNIAQRTAFITVPCDSASSWLLNASKTIHRSVFFFFPSSFFCVCTVLGLSFSGWIAVLYWMPFFCLRVKLSERFGSGTRAKYIITPDLVPRHFRIDF